MTKTDLVYADSGKPAAWPAIRQFVLERDGHVCVDCGSPADEVDHRWPRRLGGNDHSDNLAAVCGPCNKAKGGTALVEFLTAANGQAAADQLKARVEALLDELVSLANCSLDLGHESAFTALLEAVESIRCRAELDAYLLSLVYRSVAA